MFFVSECGGIHRESTGIIKSHFDNGEYEANMNCTWIIVAPENHKIELNWMAIHLELTEGLEKCNRDYIKIIDNDQEIARYCGNMDPPKTVSSTNIIRLQLVTDEVVQYNGFEVSYRFTNFTSSNCNRQFLSNSGIIIHSNKNVYNCFYSIKVSQGKQITLKVNNFTINSDKNCNLNYLEIR